MSDKDVEEAVATLQIEVSALRHLLKMLLVQHALQNPDSLKALSGVFAHVASKNGDSEEMVEEVQSILRQTHDLVKVVSG